LTEYLRKGRNKNTELSQAQWFMSIILAISEEATGRSVVCCHFGQKSSQDPILTNKKLGVDKCVPDILATWET
jgi:hypothetical protein